MKNAFMNMIRNAVSAEVRQEAEERGQLTLGMLKAKLKECDSSKTVAFDRGGYPSDTHSYRGYYDQLSVGKHNEETTVAEFVRMLEDATGATYTGYKGGQYRMNDYTMVWQSEYGTASGLAIVGVKEQDEAVIIITKDTYS